MLGGYLGKVAVKNLAMREYCVIWLVFIQRRVTADFIASQMVLESIWPILTPFCLIAAANGALYPIVVNRALANAKQAPATAAGLQNSLQICIKSLSSALCCLQWQAKHKMVIGIAIVIL